MQKGFRRQTQHGCGQVLHKPGVRRIRAKVRRAEEAKFCKSLISWDILKITGQILKKFYVPEYAENQQGQSSSQSYPQKWKPAHRTRALTDNQAL
ncbi:hypothetical protein [Limnohabitans sp. 2KL-27]|uniref:hypothetical protein n=1 Tax=Limnohabitans sp. 2KL-27 TaxID=1100705 RepID=UPI001892B154|nr:hypothetical protein [Limnohabitans sp. 2KL-27]